MLRGILLIFALSVIGFALLPAPETDGDEPTAGPGLGLVSSILGGDEAPETAARAGPRARPRGPTQTYWQYIENGKVRFAASLDEVPEAWRARAGRVELDGPPPDTPAAARSAREARTAHIKLPSARRTRSGGGGGTGAVNPNSYPEVVIYTTQSCPHCRKAIAHLDRLGVPYVNKDVENDRGAEEEYLEKGKGRRGVPLIDVGGKILRGYSPRSLDDALKQG
jgi:glutaredoxin